MFKFTYVETTKHNKQTSTILDNQKNKNNEEAVHKTYKKMYVVICKAR